MCVYAPRAETSSDAWCASPHRTRFWSNRLVPGVTYASTPMIGLIPWFLAFCQKSNAPNRYPWSVMAIGRLTEPVGLGEQVVQARRAVEHRVLGVHVEVDEVGASS